MRRPHLLAVTLAAVLIFTAGCGHLPSLGFTASSETVQALIRQTELAQSALLSGDASAYSVLYTHSDELVVFDETGGPPLKGWAEVEPKLVAQAKSFMEGDSRLEILKSSVAPGRIELVFIERNQALFKGEKEPRRFPLRVTQVYVREDGAWRIVHRHADALIETQYD